MDHILHAVGIIFLVLLIFIIVLFLGFQDMLFYHYLSKRPALKKALEKAYNDTQIVRNIAIIIAVISLIVAYISLFFKK